MGADRLAKIIELCRVAQDLALHGTCSMARPAKELLGHELCFQLLGREYRFSELLETETGRNRAQEKQRQFDEEKRDDGVLKRHAAPGQQCRRRQTLADERRYRHSPNPLWTEWAPIPA